MVINKDKTEIEAEVRHILSFHKGKDNRISRWEIVERVFGREAAANRGNNNPFDRQIRDVVRKYRDTDFICSSSGQAGYWIANGMEDVNEIADQMRAQARALEEQARTVVKRGVEYFGPQIELFKTN